MGKKKVYLVGGPPRWLKWARQVLARTARLVGGPEGADVIIVGSGGWRGDISDALRSKAIVVHDEHNPATATNLERAYRDEGFSGGYLRPISPAALGRIVNTKLS